MLCVREKVEVAGWGEEDSVDDGTDSEEQCIPWRRGDGVTKSRDGGLEREDGVGLM